jgi:hypothetical protein
VTDAAVLILDLYTREGCHLCEDMIESLQPRIRGRATLRVHDIDTDTALRARYDIRVPVLEYNGSPISEYVLDVEALSAVLGQS